MRESCASARSMSASTASRRASISARTSRRQQPIAQQARAHRRQRAVEDAEQRAASSAHSCPLPFSLHAMTPSARGSAASFRRAASCARLIPPAGAEMGHAARLQLCQVAQQRSSGTERRVMLTRIPRPSSACTRKLARDLRARGRHRTPTPRAR